MELFPFQQRTFEILSRGQSVILQAPTGSGKTWAALYPFKQHLEKSTPDCFPRQCIYSVPMRVLANQFEANYQKDMNCAVTIQTGDRPDDMMMSKGDLIFTTIDQTLSNALGVPYSLGRGRANLNAGAVFSSYLIFDEFHLFPRDGALKTTLQVLRLLKDLVPFVLMTATFSSVLLDELKPLLGAEIVTVPAEEIRQIPSQEGKIRHFHSVEAALTAEAILRCHDCRSIAICNTVDRAQQLYIGLSTRMSPENLILLHSRFTREDRGAKEERVRREFGKEKAAWSDKDLILVATQVVEVGLDITCQNLHTEVAPAASVLQRAGRCARFEGECGDVYVYDVPTNTRGEPNYAPYTGKGDSELCQGTWGAFLARDGKALDFWGEQEVIDQVHTTADQRMLEEMRQQEREIWNMMVKAIGSGDNSVRRDLIRKVDSRTLLVHDEPDVLGNPFAYSGFSLWHGTLRGKYAELEEWRKEKGLDWVLKYPVEVEEAEEDARSPIRYRWKAVTSRNDIETAFLFAIHPSLATYDEQIGFRFTSEGGEYRTPPSQRDQKQREAYKYQLESYSDHVQKMMHVYRWNLANRLAYAIPRLEQKANLPTGGIDRAIRLAIALHDLGKLQEDWQAWIRAYQAEIGEPLDDDAFMAVHTHSETPEHEAAAQRIKLRRPPHAGEGAIAGVKITRQIVEGNDRLERAVITAITRHHSARTNSFKEYQLHREAEKAVGAALEAVCLESNTAKNLLPKGPRTNLEDKILLLPPGDSILDWLAYFLIVRTLRLADGSSQEE